MQQADRRRGVGTAGRAEAQPNRTAVLSSRDPRIPHHRRDSRVPGGELWRAVATRRVAVALGKGLLETNCGDLQRVLVAREAVKTFLRLGYFVEFDTMTDEELRVACQSQYRRAVMALRRS